jgi:capsular exopolysaccharide synthesis family protein
MFTGATEVSNLAGFLNVIRRRWIVIASCVVLFAGLTIALVTHLERRYTAEALVMLDTGRAKVVIGQQPVLPGLQAEGVVAVVLKTETEVLRSPALAEKVIDKLGLLNTVEFNPTLTEPLTVRLRAVALSLLPAELVETWWPPPPKPTPAELQQLALAGAIDKLTDRVAIENDGKSYVLRIKSVSADPQRAADIANTYAELYLVEQLNAKYQEASRLNTWLTDRLGELQRNVRDTDRAVQLFKAQHNITNLNNANGGTVNSQQISEINTQLVLAESERAQKEALLRQLQDAKRTGRGGEVTQVLGSPLIQALRAQEADLERKLADLQTHYLGHYPAVMEAKAQVADLRRKIDDETNKILQGMTNDISAARTREDALRTRLHELEGGAATQDQAEVQLRELMRQADANKTLYEAFLQKFKQSSAEQDLDQPEAHVVSTAQVPTRPSWPPKVFFVSVAALVSTLIGVILAFCLERLDNCFRSSSELESASGLPNLSLVPAVGNSEKLAAMIVSKPMSPYTESVRSVWASLYHHRGKRPLKVILVTSSVPGEGKSTFAISLAQAAANSGARTLLVDCDLRRPSVHKALGIASRQLPGHGILNLLKGGAGAQEDVLVHQESGVELMLSGGSTDNPQALLQSPAMRRYLSEMRDQYDCVVIDSPPILLASDASVLSHLADATLLAVRWEKTPRHVALNGLKVLRSNGGFIAGTILTQVNLRKQATYGFGDLGYYYKSYRNYST